MILTTVVTDLRRTSLGPLREGMPDLSAQGLWHAAVFAIGMLAVVAAATGLKQAVGASAAPLGRLYPLWPERRFDLVCAVLTFAAVIGALAMLLVSPKAYHDFSLEDGLLEWLSAAFPFLASITIASVVWRLRDRSRMPLLGLLALAVYAVVCFFIAGEEASWLQRVIGFETPPTTLENDQNQFNLHNFATNRFENAYYFAAGFVLLVVLPLWREFRLPLGPLQPLAEAFPRTHMLLYGAIITAYNFDMWIGVPTQLAFWGMVAGLLCYLRRAQPADARAAWALLLAALGLQGLLLVCGGDTGRLWDHTEYKELLISWALWVHAMGLRELAK